jgi:CRP-like cAMP-binding protein
MLEKLKRAINSKVEISDTEIAQIEPFLALRKYDKNELLLKEGEICSFVGFLNSGLIRCWSVDSNGKELTTQFIFENCFFTYLEGLLQPVPSHKNYIAIENCEAILLKKEHLQKVLEINPKFEAVFRLLLFDESLMQMEANENKRKESPAERYLKFLRQNPTASDRIPIKHIASFLGIEPESLSRIRKRLSKTRK